MTVYQKRTLLLAPIVVALLVVNARTGQSAWALVPELAIVAWFVRRG